MIVANDVYSKTGYILRMIVVQKNRCVDCLRDINLDDVYYKPLAEVSE